MINFDSYYCDNCGTDVPYGQRFFVMIGNETSDRNKAYAINKGREYVLCRECSKDLISSLNASAWENIRKRREEHDGGKVSETQ